VSSEDVVSDSDQEAIQHRVDKKLAALRAAIKEGLDSGPAEPLDMEAILAEARADHRRRKDAIASLPEALADLKREARAIGLTDAIIDAELEAWRNERKANPSKSS
jgi:hypothetical protein